MALNRSLVLSREGSRARAAQLLRMGALSKGSRVRGVARKLETVDVWWEPYRRGPGLKSLTAVPPRAAATVALAPRSARRSFPRPIPLAY